MYAFLACSTALSLTPADAQTFDRYVMIQPIQVCNDDGSNCTPVTNFPAETRAIYAQAKVLPVFLPTTQLLSTTENTTTTGIADIDGDGAGGGTTVEAWFVSDLGGSLFGEAWVGGNGLVVDGNDVANFNGGNGRRDTFAHELGHNLGLGHGDFGAGGADNLLTSGGSRSIPGGVGDINPNGAQLSMLTQDQIDELRSSSLVQTAVNCDGGGGADVITKTFGEVCLNLRGFGGNDILTLTGGAVLQDLTGGDGNDIISILAGGVGGDVLGDGGNDTITLAPGGFVFGSVDGGSGDDTITIASDPVNVFGGIGDDVIVLNAGTIVTQSVFGDDGDGDEGNGDGNDIIVMNGGSVGVNVDGEGGDDDISIKGGSVGGSVLGGGGLDTIVVSGGAITGNVEGGAANDQISILGGTVGGDVLGGSGADTMTLSAGAIGGNLDGGSEGDTITVNGGSVANVLGGTGGDIIAINGGSVTAVFGGADGDLINLNGGTITGNLDGEGGDDTITISGGSVAGVLGGSGADIITLNSGTVSGFLDGGSENDIITIVGGSVGGSVVGGSGADTILLDGTAVVARIFGGDGADAIGLLGGTVNEDVEGGNEDDSILLDGAAVAGNIVGGSGADDIALLSGSVGSVFGESGADSILLDGAAVGGNINAGADADVITLLAGTVGGSVIGGSGADSILLDGAAVAFNIVGGTGDDQIDIRSGSVTSVLAGDDNDTAVWTGGTIATLADMGTGTDSLDIYGVNAGGTALQAGLTALDGGDDASSADGQIDTLNLRGVDEVLTDLKNWEFINLLNNSVGDLGLATRSIITEQFFVEEGSILVAKSGVGSQVYTIDGNVLNHGLVDMLGNGPSFYDELAVSGVYTGGGVLGAKFAIDSFLGVAGSPSDLMRVGTATDGVTGILVNDTNAGPGVYNPVGIEVVRVEGLPGETAKEHFFLVGGPIQKDLWTWDLALDDTRSLPGRANADVHVLYSRPGEEVQFSPYFATGALTAFHASLEPWVHRQQTLWDTVALKGSVPGAGSTSVDLWVSPFGARRFEDSVSKLTFFGDTFTADMSYGQITYGVQGGVDVISNKGRGTALMAGLFGGYLNSSMSPDKVSVRGDFEGGSFGAYASYMDGGFMLSAVFQANLLGFDWRAPALGLDADADVETYGGRIEAAYRLMLTPTGGWLQPYANVTYAKGSFEDFKVLATTFAIGDNESLLGRLGLRVGADVNGEGSLLKVFAGAGVVHEFNDSNTADIVSGGLTLPLTHELNATSLELQGGVRWTDIGKGLSLSITSSGRFSEDVQEYGGKATVNVQF